MDETYIKVAGHWKNRYRAVDRAGDTADFLLTAKRDKAAVRRFLERAINLHDLPEKITIDNHRAVKKITGPMLGFKSFWSARIIIAGIETTHMVKKGQMDCPDGTVMSASQQFYSLAV